MPELNPDNLPPSSASKAVEVVRAVLEKAQGLHSSLNVSCKLGIDAILADAIDGKLPEANLPCIRIAYATTVHKMASNAGVVLWKLVHLHLFFLSYHGKHGGSVLPQRFTELRDRWITENLNYLKNKNVLPRDSIGIDVSKFKDDAGNVFWRWPDGEQDMPQEDETPFDVLGIGVPINPSSGMACSRVDLALWVKTNATFNS